MCLPLRLFDPNKPKPLPDIVQTQGRFLVPQPHTPMERASDIGFAENLRKRLQRVELRHRWRVRDYGRAAAEEWPHRHTPPHIRQEFEDRQKSLRAKREAYVSPDDGSDGPAPWSPQFAQTGTPPSSCGSLTQDSPAHNKHLIRNTPPNSDEKKWIYPGIWHGWEDGEEPNPPNRPSKVSKRRSSEMSKDHDDAEADDESHPRRRQKRAGTFKPISAVQTDTSLDNPSADYPAESSPRRSARLKLISSVPRSDSTQDQVSSRGKRLAEDGFRPRRSARLTSTNKSSRCGIQRSPRARFGRRRTIAHPLDAG
jgi:hypothetical protein